MIRVIFISFFLFVISVEAYAKDSSQVGIDISKIIIKPEIIENNDEECGNILEDARKKFFSEINFLDAYGIQEEGYRMNGAVLDWITLGGVYLNQVEAYGKLYYLNHIENIGCGGACSSNQSVVSDEPVTGGKIYDYSKEMAKQATPAASYNYLIAKNSNNIPYLFIVGRYQEYKNELLIYKLVPEGRWKSACKIVLWPKNYSDIQDEYFSSAIQSINDLNSALGELSPGAGSTCGSAGTHDRWVAQTHDNLIQVLFRPWERKDVGVYRGNSHGHYDKTMEGLEKWSLTGVSEYDAFAAYNKQLANTIVSVSGLFQKKYGWSPVLSKELAENALKSAVSSGFGFYMYDPQFSLGEEMLRRRILDKRPIGEIKATEFDVGKVDEEENQYSIGYGLQESILNIAVTYPEALEYLLAKGVYPDMPNAFGKTPLMYAVQANQLETVKILLRAGANPNARTIRPNDTCYYSLSTIGMTPLHYAVRYASPEITRVLLDYGAVPLLKTESGNFSELIRVNGAVQIHRYKNDGDVVAWFDRYNGEKSLERNTNIPIERLDEIKAWLTINAILIPELVNKYILKAEKLYQSNDVNGAYIAIDLALALDSLNIRALADMSLIAIKIKKLGKSIEASRIVLETSNSNKEISSAWFNQGLACEMAADNSQYGVAYLRFNGNDYCSAGDIYPFYKSIVVNDSVVRRNKLLDKLEKGAHKESGVVKDCAIPGREIKLLFRIVQDPDEKRHKQAQFIYILHSKKESISVEDLKWKVRNYEGNGSGYKTITPILYDNVNLGDYDLTIYKSEEAVSFPHEYYGYTCDYHREKIH